MRAAYLFPYRDELRAGTLQAVEGLSEHHLDWKPEGGINTIRGWLRHIAQSEDWWIQAVVLGRPDLVRGRTGRVSDLPTVLDYLGQTRAATERLLTEWPASKLSETRRLPEEAGGPLQGVVLSLHWIIGNLYNHEFHHRGQIYLYLRLMGVDPPAY